MQNQIIENYVEKILNDRLNTFGIEEKYIKIIKENIKEQIYSLIYHWNDIEFRKAILIIGMEEGKFYEPDADLDIKNFVVIAIRNSYLECIFSVDYATMGLDNPINENLVKVITSEAIEYFKNINFSELSKNISSLNINDIYGNIVEKYPLAWNSLIELSKCVSKKSIYKNITKSEKSCTKEFNKICEHLNLYENKNNVKDVQSGISNNFSEDLCIMLNNIIHDENGLLYIDCFKMATRNLNKLLTIIEILLENNNYILTSNYLITNSYVGKRIEIIKASHTINDMKNKMKNSSFFSGLSKFHYTLLKLYTEQLLQEM